MTTPLPETTEPTIESSPRVPRRDVLKGTVAGILWPAAWAAPVVLLTELPAHAYCSPHANPNTCAQDAGSPQQDAGVDSGPTVVDAGTDAGVQGPLKATRRAGFGGYVDLSWKDVPNTTSQKYNVFRRFPDVAGYTNNLTAVIADATLTSATDGVPTFGTVRYSITTDPSQLATIATDIEVLPWLTATRTGSSVALEWEFALGASCTVFVATGSGAAQQATTLSNVSTKHGTYTHANAPAVGQATYYVQIAVPASNGRPARTINTIKVTV